MCCEMMLTNKAGDRVEIVFGEFIEYTSHLDKKTVSFWWNDMDLAEHGEIAAWPIWKESWISYEAIVLSFRHYDRRRNNL